MKFEGATHPETVSNWPILRCRRPDPAKLPGLVARLGAMKVPNAWLGRKPVKFPCSLPKKNNKASSGKGWEGVKEALPKTNQTPNGSITQTKDWVLLG